MKKFYVVLRKLEDLSVHWTGRAEGFEEKEVALTVAAHDAGISNEPRYVAQVIGVQRPTYDPHIGWQEAE